jgi:hypothetical protein
MCIFLLIVTRDENIPHMTCLGTYVGTKMIK